MRQDAIFSPLQDRSAQSGPFPMSTRLVSGPAEPYPATRTADLRSRSARQCGRPSFRRLIPLLFVWEASSKPFDYDMNARTGYKTGKARSNRAKRVDRRLICEQLADQKSKCRCRVVEIRHEKI